jgi:cystathionine beta-synthase
MKNLNRTVLDVVGNTPIIKLQKVAKDVSSEIYVKLEYMNPGGSVKDRIGVYMLQKAMEKGHVKPGLSTIIEATSGNTGIGLAMFCAVHGLKSIFVLNDKQSQEKINNLRSFGAKVIVCPTNVDHDDPRSYYNVAIRLSQTIPHAYYVDQYNNPENTEAHVKTTGPEIYEQTNGEFDVLMGGLGTGGTISGSAKFLKTKMPNLKVVAVDPEGSILGPYKKTGEIIHGKPYMVEGIGQDFFPKNVDFSVIDDFVTIGDKESFLMTRKLLSQEGIYCGGSCGTAVAGAIKYAKTLKDPKKILVILPDSGNRYGSKIFNDDWMKDKGYLDSSFNVQVSEVLNRLGKKKGEVVTITENTTVTDAINMMKTNDISQLPVVAGSQIIGVVSENQLLRPLFDGKLAGTDNVSVAYTRNFQVIDINEMLDKVAEALVRKEVVFVTEKGKIVDILTDIDILNFMSSQGRY